MHKNEADSSDMIEILEHYQQYCPQNTKSITPIPVGGDGLSVLNGMSAKAARRDGGNPIDRLQGVILKSEDWHKDTITCLQVFRSIKLWGCGLFSTLSDWIKHVDVDKNKKIGAQILCGFNQSALRLVEFKARI